MEWGIYHHPGMTDIAAEEGSGADMSSLPQ
jgi:hypothetical protein